MLSLLWTLLAGSILILAGPAMAIQVTAMWSSLGQWSESPYDNYTKYTFRYKTFDLVRLASISEHYTEAEEKCTSTQMRLPRLEDLGGELFQRRIFNNNNFIRVSVTKQFLQSDPSQPGGFKRIHQWTREQGRFFLASPETRVKRLVELDKDSMLTLLVASQDMNIRDRSPSIILCVQERQLPRPPPPPPPPPPPRPPVDGTTNVVGACACSSGRLGGGIGDSAAAWWPLAAVACLGILCLSLATALLIVCRTRRRAVAEAAAAAASAAAADAALAGACGGKNGHHSMPRTTSSLMDFNPHHHNHQHEKGRALAAQTMSRKPRIIHHGQVHTNGYLTLGSIQARKQREMIGQSEPPSPNHSIATRSDYQQALAPPATSMTMPRRLD